MEKPAVPAAGYPTVPLPEIAGRALELGWSWWRTLSWERFTENTYALLYLKNIDSQTRRELAPPGCCRRDPLTRVYNRTTFRSEVEEYMAAETDREGILILLDVDNFKGINDRFGHLEGDKVLKRVTALLQATFRSDDVIGRLGGDEFIVFYQKRHAARDPGKTDADVFVQPAGG